MDSDNESYNSKSKFYYLDKDFRPLRPFHTNPIEKNRHIICQLRLANIGKKTVHTNSGHS